MRTLDVKTASGDTITVNKIVLGTATMGSSISEEDSFGMLDYFYEKGGNCVDTARGYAHWLPGGDGMSERTLGRWLKSRGNRSKITLCTKGAGPVPNMTAPRRLSREEILQDLEESLQNLGVDYVDIYYLHRDDKARPVSDIMETLDMAVKAGKVRVIAVSNWETARIDEANAYAAKNNMVSFTASEIFWSIMECTLEQYGNPEAVTINDTEYKGYKKNGIPVFAYGSQALGFFSKNLGEITGSGLEGHRQRFATPVNLKIRENVLKLSQKTGFSPAALIVSYLTHLDHPVAPILGCTKLSQLSDSMTAQDVNLTAETLMDLKKQD